MSFSRITPQAGGPGQGAPGVSEVAAPKGASHRATGWHEVCNPAGSGIPLRSEPSRQGEMCWGLKNGDIIEVVGLNEGGDWGVVSVDSVRLTGEAARNQSFASFSHLWACFALPDGRPILQPSCAPSQAGHVPPPPPPPLSKSAALPEVAPAQATPPPVVFSTLREAIIASDAREVARLLAAGEDPNGLDELGETPLFEAVSGGNVEVVAELLLASADPLAQAGDAGGLTPVAFAEEPRVLAVLRAFSPPLREPDGNAAELEDLTAAVRALPPPLQRKILEALNARGIALDAARFAADQERHQAVAPAETQQDVAEALSQNPLASDARYAALDPETSSSSFSQVASTGRRHAAFSAAAAAAGLQPVKEGADKASDQPMEADSPLEMHEVANPNGKGLWVLAAPSPNAEQVWALPNGSIIELGDFDEEFRFRRIEVAWLKRACKAAAALPFKEYSHLWLPLRDRTTGQVLWKPHQKSAT